ncbi:MAG: S-ribosylhomocysteine lyase [Acholeplasmatales bacterium]|nr:S-ribosylhomocysteine lyase [Acholeplasmatales bacterium]
MEKIESFKVDHRYLMPGIYISRVDTIDNFTFTTFDLRFTRPNNSMPMDTGSIHAIEHLAATYFRNYNKNTMYFGPMGCRTGFYLLLAGKVEVEDIKNQVIDCMKFIINYEDEIVIGATEIECGNYKDMNLEKAKYYAKEFLKWL